MSISMETALNQVGFTNLVKTADSLQGTVYKALNKFTNNKIVIKVTNKYLHQNGMAITNNEKYYNIDENILLEAAIMKHLMQNQKVPQSIIKFHDFFECKRNYYLIMEDGGDDLFDFVVKAHRLISMGILDICEWHKVVHVVFKQLVECLQFIHSQNVCHNDLSLENFLINDVRIHCFENVQNEQSKIRFVCNDIQVKVIDFGLASKFEANNFQSNKYCGKTPYKSPEIVSKKTRFDAKANDVWSLGICLWMMVFGCKPFEKARHSDQTFVLLMNGRILDVLTAWNKVEYANEDLIDLFQSFFQYEDKRICLNQIRQHSWLTVKTSVNA